MRYIVRSYVSEREMPWKTTVRLLFKDVGDDGDPDTRQKSCVQSRTCVSWKIAAHVCYNVHIEDIEVEPCLEKFWS